MIIDFTVENFRSIKDEQLFSMYAERKPKHHAGNIEFIDPDIGILKTAAIYGANASGKTNLLLAVDALREMVVESGSLKDGDAIKGYEPYLLSSSSRESDTKFEIEFIVKKTRYSYSIHYNRERISFEKLDVYRSSRPSNLFTRDEFSDPKTIKFGDSFRGGRKAHAFFRNNSYLSKAGNNPESPDFIRDIYNYFYRSVNVLENGARFGVRDWEKSSYIRNVVDAFLSKADFGIEKFEINEIDLPEGLEKFPDSMPKPIREEVLDRFGKERLFYHKGESGELIEFDYKLESHGTRSLLDLIPYISMVLKHGEVLMIDEIESSLHPHIAELVIRLFNDQSVNRNGAQLIFTTHDISLMSQRLLRKDQVYLCSKTAKTGTEYSSLDQFDSSLRDSSPFSKWYNEGRFGGIPEINYKDIANTLKNME
ncbi:ATP-binding protein [Idiomarina sp. HB]|uniref:AAA family ATPase n=1 Tax=Idiomarina sp. HB TaxID=3110479 RepID=UPI003A8139C8